MSTSARPHDVRFGNPLLAERVGVSRGNDEITEQHCSRAFPVRMVVCDVDDPLPEFEAWWTVNPSAARHIPESPRSIPAGKVNLGWCLSHEPTGLNGPIYQSSAYAVLREVPDPVLAGLV